MASKKRIPARKRKPSVANPASQSAGEYLSYAVDFVDCDDEPGGDGPRVEHVGLDLNEYTLKHILPGAAELCEQGIQREIAAERDVRQGERNAIWFVEVSRGQFETTSQLPHGMPPLRWTGRATQAHWEYVLHLDKYRVARGERGRKMARETTFLQAGSGVQG